MSLLFENSFDGIVELEGEVVSVVWANPHVRFSVKVVNAAGEEAGIFEDGYVIVTRDAKTKLLAASAQMRTADEEGRKAAWADAGWCEGSCWWPVSPRWPWRFCGWSRP